MENGKITITTKPDDTVGFSHAGPTAWNSLPHHLHHISDTGLFKRRLKTELFRRAYVASC